MKWLLVLLFFPFLTFSQDEIGAAVEYITIFSDEEIEVEVLTQELVYLSQNPISLNEATLSELLNVPFFNQIQVLHIIEYRKRNQGIRIAQELKLIAGFNEKLIEIALPFISFEGSVLKKFHQTPQTKFLTRIHTVLPSEQFALKKNLAWWHQVQVNSIFPNTTLSINAEKDQLEKYFYNDKSIEQLSFSLDYTPDNQTIKRVVIGDYRINLGQGLVIKNGFNTSKSNFISGVFKFQNKVLSAKTTGSEFGYLRGAALHFSLLKNKQSSDWSILSFVAKQKLDANLELDEEGNEFVSTIYETGTHVTQSELENRNQLQKIDLGGQLTYKSDQFNFAWNHSVSLLDKNLNPDFKYYNVFYPRGKRFYNQSLSFNAVVKNHHFFGEFAINKSFIPAFTLGMSGGLFQDFEYAVQIRDYHWKYNALNGNGYQRQGNLGNEKGLIFRAKFPISKHWNGAVFADFYQFSKPKYLTRFPSIGHEKRIVVNYHNAFDVSVQYRTVFSQKSINNGAITFDKLNINKHGVQVKFVIPINESLALKIGTVNNFSFDTTWTLGKLFYQEIQYRTPLTSVNFNISFFDVESFNSRVYAYESSLLYSSPFKQFTGTGFRTYLKVKKQLSQQFQSSIKVSYQSTFKDLGLKQGTSIGILLKYDF